MAQDKKDRDLAGAKEILALYKKKVPYVDETPEQWLLNPQLANRAWNERDCHQGGWKVQRRETKVPPPALHLSVNTKLASGFMGTLHLWAVFSAVDSMEQLLQNSHQCRRLY